MTDETPDALQPDPNLSPEEQAKSAALVPPPTVEAFEAAEQIATDLAAEQDGGIEDVAPTVESEPGRGEPSDDVRKQYGL